jgi:hypothetical protein
VCCFSLPRRPRTSRAPVCSLMRASRPSDPRSLLHRRDPVSVHGDHAHRALTLLTSLAVYCAWSAGSGRAINRYPDVPVDGHDLLAAPGRSGAGTGETAMTLGKGHRAALSDTTSNSVSQLRPTVEERSSMPCSMRLPCALGKNMPKCGATQACGAQACLAHGVDPDCTPLRCRPPRHRKPKSASADHALYPRCRRSNPRAVHHLSTVSPLGLVASLLLR